MSVDTVYTIHYKKTKYIHTVATGMFGSLVSCSTTLFTMVETVEGVELRGGVMVELARVEGVVVVALMV